MNNKRKIIAIVTVLLLITMVFVAGCDSFFQDNQEDDLHENQAKTPKKSSDLEGENYLDVIKWLEDSGFTNIKTTKIEDLITGWLTKDGEVDSVSIGGKSYFSKGEWFDKDIEIVIEYHTFPNNDDDDNQDNSNNNDDVTHENQAKTPKKSSDLEGENYLDVVKWLEDSGFTNIKTTKIEDLITGWLTKDGEVESVSIGGTKNFTKGQWFDKDIEIVVEYHTFPENNNSDNDSENNDDDQSQPTVTPCFSQEYAHRAVVVALTNYFAIDVYTDDGVDPSKFHTYADRSGDHLLIEKRGTYEVKDENTWVVKDLRLRIYGYFTEIKVTAEVYYSNGVYSVSNISGYGPSLPDLSVIEIDDWFKAASSMYDEMLVEERVYGNSWTEYQAKKAAEDFISAIFNGYSYKFEWYLHLPEKFEGGEWYIEVPVTISDNYGNEIDILLVGFLGGQDIVTFDIIYL